MEKNVLKPVTVFQSGTPFAKLLGIGSAAHASHCASHELQKMDRPPVLRWDSFSGSSRCVGASGWGGIGKGYPARRGFLIAAIFDGVEWTGAFRSPRFVWYGHVEHRWHGGGDHVSVLDEEHFGPF